MIKLATDSFLFIDELKFYQELYAKGVSRFKPKEVFYDLPHQFVMDSQVNAQSTVAKRKSTKRPALQENCFLSQNTSCVSFAYDQFIKAWHVNCGFDKMERSSAAGGNNLAAREAVRNAPSSNFSLKDFSSLDVCQLDEETVEVVLDEPILCINSAVQTLLLKDKKSSRSYIIPAKSSFLSGHIGMIRHFLHREMKYDFIIADPPWPNKSVKRKKSYACLEIDDVLASLPIPLLLEKGGLVCIWLSNSASVHHKTEEILKSWGLVKLAMWHWLKVCTSNMPIVDFGRPEHKVPFESMLFACFSDDLPLFTAKIRDNFCVISVPNANPSRKPPVAEILNRINIFRSLNALELFARYLLPYTTSVGLETLKFQDEYFYESYSE